MNIIKSNQTIDGLLEVWKPELERDFPAYRNHVYRVLNLASALAAAKGEDLEKLAVASAFHDIAIWLDQTFDYLGPSARRATAYLVKTGRESWVPEVRSIISQHHKVFPWRGHQPRLVEAFRRADWLDVCLFVLPTRLPRSFLADLVNLFPREGFHRRLVELTLSWARRHPLRPLPMFKL